MSVFFHSVATFALACLMYDNAFAVANLVQEEQEAAEVFKDASPFVAGALKDVGKLRQALLWAGETFVQLDSNLALARAALRQEQPTPANKTTQTVLSRGKAAANSTKIAAAATNLVKAELDKLQMPATLGLVKSMYDSWKGKIASANKFEEAGKVKFEARMKDIEDRKRKHKDNKKALAEDEQVEKYWKKQRDLSKRQYHTTLKMMHGGMEKFKTVIAATKDATAGKEPAGAVKQALGRMVPPEVVFLQSKVKDLIAWTKGATAILRDAQNPHRGMACTSTGRA